LSKFICFVHIEKAGGITLHNILYTLLNCYLTPNPNFGEQFTKQDLIKLFKVWPIKITGIGGHRLGAFLGYEGALNKEVFYLTFLREPIRRYMSHLNWQKNVMSIDWTAESFANDIYFNNFQCYRISGKRTFLDAKKIISQKYGFVGLLERYDQSLIILEKILGLRQFSLQYSKANQKEYGFRSIKYDELTPDIQTKIVHNNQEDIKLYRYVLDELYPRYEHSYGATLPSDLNKFLILNKTFRLPIHIVLKRKFTNFLLSRIVQPYLIK